MLTLIPPYPVIDGYPLLPDHEDPDLWYVFPTAPVLGLAAGRPALSLTQYSAGAAVSGGILSLTTQLVVPPDVLAALPARLADARGATSSHPRVVPVVFDTGSVELVVLGQTSTPPPNGSAAPGGTFEVRFSSGGRPSMGASNDSTFQLVLNEAAAEMMGDCLELPELPVTVTYVMSYAALRPAFTIDIHADWHKVYSSLQNKLTANAWFVAADVDTAITHAMEESGIDVETVVESTGDGAASAAENTRQQLLDWVLDKLFEPMAPPPDPAASIGQVVEDTVWSLTRAIIPGASYRLKQLEEDQLRQMNIRARERVAESRELRPQGTIGGLLRQFRLDKDGQPSTTWPGIRDQLLRRVALSGFPRLDVGVDVVDRFASDGVRTVEVELTHGAPPAEGEAFPPSDAVLAFTEPGQHHDYTVELLEETDRASVWDRPYRYRVSVEFDPASPLRPAGPAVSPWADRQAVDLLVDPREAYAVTDVTVTVAPLFSFALFPAVSVELHPGPDPTDSSRTGRVELTAAAPLQHWLFASTPEDVSFSWRATYRRPVEAGGDVTSDWSGQLEPFLSLPDPMPEKLTVTFFVDLPWNEIAAAILQLRYDDDEHDIRYAPETIPLVAGTANLSRTYSIATGGSRALGYRLTIQPSMGGLVDGSWRTATDDRVVVDRRLVDERQIQVRLVGGTLAEHQLLHATLRLEVRDPADEHVRASKDIDIAPGSEAGFQSSLDYLLGDPPMRQVWWQLTTVDANGFVAVQPWGSGTSDLIVADLRSRSVTG